MSTKFALREIKRRKVQSLTNILGYAFTIGFLVILISLAQGFNVVTSGELRGIGNILLLIFLDQQVVLVKVLLIKDI